MNNLICTAIRAAAQCYIELIIKESDNNVKLIVLDRLIALKSTPSAERVVQELVMDILRVLGPATSDLEVGYITLLEIQNFKCLIVALSYNDDRFFSRLMPNFKNLFFLGSEEDIVLGAGPRHVKTRRRNGPRAQERGE